MASELVPLHRLEDSDARTVWRHRHTQLKVRVCCIFLCVFLVPSAVLPIGGCLFASVILFVLLCWVTAHTLQGVLPLCLVALFVYFLFVFFLHLFL